MNKWVNHIWEGDCLQVMKELPDGSVDMVLCDLPYGITRNAWDRPIDLKALWEQYLRVVKAGGVIALSSTGFFTAKLIMSNPAMFKYKLVWVKSVKTNFLNARKQPLRCYEDICIFYGRQPTYNPQMTAGRPYELTPSKASGNYDHYRPISTANKTGERYPSDVIHLSSAGRENRWYHPTQKPVDLGRYLIRTYSNEGDIILDNACGSGSFLVAAAIEGRKFIGIERYPRSNHTVKKGEDLISICYERIRQAQQRKELFDGKEETRQPL